MFLRKTGPGRDTLPVAMTGVRMGERLLQIGVDDPQVTGALAAKTGMSGNAVSVVPDDHAAVRARRGAAAASALIEVRVGPGDALPFFDPGTFDVVVVHGVSGVLGAMAPAARAAALREWHRVLRTGGRIVIIEPGTPVGMAAFFRGSAADPAAAGAARLADLEAAGFNAARVLADREGLQFVEGLRA